MQFEQSQDITREQMGQGQMTREQMLQGQMTREQMGQGRTVRNASAFGFTGRTFPLLAFIIGFISYSFTYLVARSKSPPDVWPFPQSDILHAAIHYPEYLIYRIGMMVYPVLFCITFQTLKNFLQIKNFEFKGQASPALNCFGPCSVIACICMCISTSAISDGGDLNNQLYFYGSRIYWLLSFVMIYRASKIYQSLWEVSHFIPEWSYNFKNYSGIIAVVLAVVYGLQLLEVVDLQFYPEWTISYFIVFYVLSLYWDLQNMDLLLRRK